jgi:cyclopropane fatty-acyl-phospholipid synthase-like methyltransferase
MTEAAAVGELYDQIGQFVELTLGGSLHYGYWDDAGDPASMSEASERMTDLMVAKLGAQPGDRLLDVGCGNGRPALRLATATGAGVLGINIAPGQVAAANEAAKEQGLDDRVRFTVTDAGDLRLEPASFDGAWLFESLLHMPDERKVLAGIGSALRPGAPLVISNLVLLTPLTEERARQLRPLWQAFQIASILPLAGYPALLAEHGFRTTEVLDVTGHSVQRTMQTIFEAQAGLRRQMSSALDGLEASQDRFADLAPDQSTDLALVTRLAEATEIGYAIIVADKERV